MGWRKIITGMECKRCRMEKMYVMVSKRKDGVEKMKYKCRNCGLSVIEVVSYPGVSKEFLKKLNEETWDAEMRENV